MALWRSKAPASCSMTKGRIKAKSPTNCNWQAAACARWRKNSVMEHSWLVDLLMISNYARKLNVQDCARASMALALKGPSSRLNDFGTAIPDVWASGPYGSICASTWSDGPGWITLLQILSFPFSKPPKRLNPCHVLDGAPLSWCVLQ